MSEKLQLAFSLLSLGLVVVAGYLALRITRSGDRVPTLAPLTQETLTPTVDVWLASAGIDDDNEERARLYPGLESVQFLLKPFLDAEDRDGFNNRALSRRLGAEEDALRFFQLVIVNFHQDQPFEIRSPFLMLVAEDPGGTIWKGRSPEAIFADGRGIMTEADRIVATALGLRSGPYEVPPRAAAHYLIALDSDADDDRWTRLELQIPEVTLHFRRIEMPRDELESFLLDPRQRLPVPEVDVARRDHSDTRSD